MKQTAYKRLDSLDVLRGLDLFMLTMVGGLVWVTANNVDLPWLTKFALANFEHVDWEGFAPWDLVMPLFMFMAGVSMPFAFSGYFKGEVSAGRMYWRITRRLLLLFLLGAVVQGNLLEFDWHRLRLFSNTLQAIGVGYFFTAIIVMNVRDVKWQAGITAALLAVFWICLALFGDYTPHGNFADKVDAAVLGHWRDCVTWDESGWHFRDEYTYTWIFSSLNFTATVLLGWFAGLVLKGNKLSGYRKCLYLVAGGIVMIAAGRIMGIWHPIIKHIWSSSMTLYAGGICWVLMGIFYLVVDVWGWKGLNWLKPLGCNSILAYLCGNKLYGTLQAAAGTLLFGFEKWAGPWYPTLLRLGAIAIFYAIFLHLYRKKWFFKV